MACTADGGAGTRIVGPQTPRTRARFALCSHRMRIAPRAVGALLVLGLSAGAAAAAAMRARAWYCRRASSSTRCDSPSWRPECGVLSVAEKSTGSCRPGNIPLHVAARAGDQPAQNRADALFILAGGPGAGGRRVLHHRGPAPSRAHSPRGATIVLIDQAAATGGSNPPRLAQRDAQAAVIAQRRTRSPPTHATLPHPAQLRAADVAYYTSSLAVAGSGARACGPGCRAHRPSTATPTARGSRSTTCARFPQRVRAG